MGEGLSAAQRVCQYCSYFQSGPSGYPGKCFLNPPVVVAFQGWNDNERLVAIRPEVEYVRPNVMPDDYCSEFS